MLFPPPPGGRLTSLLRERDIAPYVESVSPALLWTAEDADWVVLGYEAVEAARPANFRPGSTDLHTIVHLVQQIGRIPLPDVAADWRETRWDRFAHDEEEAALFAGDALLYTDIHPNNFLITSGRAWVVDWSWPTRGAAFIDPAILALQLIAAGHTPAGAEAAVAYLPGWKGGAPCAITAFAAAQARMYSAFAARKPGEKWLKALLTAAEEWTAHRRTGSGTTELHVPPPTP